ncbi:MAG: glycosyltransferase [Chitinivibrionales bacterium]|nr:glycosyltransferase [Chitinivibrionales bacterium]
MTTGFIILCVVYFLCSLLLFGYGFQCYILTYLFLRVRRKKVVEQRIKMHHFDSIIDEKEYPLVVTQLPMYNEKTVAIRIIEAVAKMDYPRARHEIQVLDDSQDETKAMVDETVERLKKTGINIEVIRRVKRIGYKAGALQHGLERTKAEFVAIFDADFVPKPDFLRKAMTFFLNRPQIGLVQGRWTHLNRKASLITRSQAMGIDGHFMIEQAARSWNDLFMNFNGTAGVFRVEAIHDAGGWHHDTLTEDMDLSYRMQLRGWKTEYVPDLEVPAEIPEDINAFKSQQFRWAKGSIQTAIKIIPMLFKQKIPFFKRMQAIMHLTHYSVHPLMLMMALLSMPMLSFVKFSIPTYLFVLLLVAIALAAGGPSFMYMVSQHFLGNKKRIAIAMIPAMMLTGTGLALSNGKAVLEAFMRKQSPFLRTPKKGNKSSGMYRPFKDITAVIEIMIGIYCMISFALFFGYHNIIVTPFLAIYASGFLFTGILSIIHFLKPSLIDYKLPMARAKNV